MIKYYKLFDLLNRKGMKKTDLLQVVSSGTLAKLSKGENIQTEVIDKICLFLECQPGDIMEFIYGESKSEGFTAVDKNRRTVVLAQTSIIEQPRLNELDESETATYSRKIHYPDTK